MYAGLLKNRSDSGVFYDHFITIVNEKTEAT